VQRLLLWDIDGTLIASSGAGRRALCAALRAIFDVDGALDEVELAGRTDRWIMREVLRKFSLPATEENFTRFFDGYLAALPAELHHSPSRILPGVQEILQAVAAGGGFAQGLLTGNKRDGARVKLGHHGLWEIFPFGAFADDSEHRNDLGAHALRRAREHHGCEFPAARVWVIGDTPHDIECGRVIGARTLAVSTGGYSLEQLRAHTPTAVLADLSDTAAVLHLLRH